MKGDGETHPFLSPDDEFADYETWDKANLNMSKLKEDSMLAGEYAREALKRGLSLEEKLGTNPYKFGLIGSTDTHTSLAYEKGVPMGGDLTEAPDGGAPSFLVAALKDPLSGNLDRIQIVKGWMDDKGDLHERIYDVAVSDEREIDADGRCRTPVGNTVDVERATWTNTIGDSELITVWSDPEFDPEQSAFYYVRVIEIPTPRWTAYEALRFGVNMPDEVPMITQERAYTSPIWYTSNNR